MVEPTNPNNQQNPSVPFSEKKAVPPSSDSYPQTSVQDNSQAVSLNKPFSGIPPNEPPAVEPPSGQRPPSEQPSPSLTSETQSFSNYSAPTAPTVPTAQPVSSGSGSSGPSGLGDVSQGNVASFSERLLAYWTDNCLLSLLGISFVGAGLFSFFGTSSRLFGHTTGFIMNPLYLSPVLLGALYFVLCWTFAKGQTIGKRLVAIRVVKEDGRPLEIMDSILRVIGYYISSLFFSLGFIWVLFDAKKQGWHDKIAHTLVVKTDQKPKKAIAWAIVSLSLISTIIVLGLAFFFSWKIFRSFRIEDTPNLHQDLYRYRTPTIRPRITPSPKGNLF